MIVVKASVEELIASFAQAWPLQELKTRADATGFHALGTWLKAHRDERRIDPWSLDNPGTGAYAFWQDGAWAVLSDRTHILTADQDALAALSRRFGLVLVFDVESTAEVAEFMAFDGGRRIRAIRSLSDRTTTSGRKLWRELGIPIRHNFMNETERLQRRFGITPWDKLPDDMAFKAVAFVDRQDCTESQASFMARLAEVTAAR